MNTSATYTNGVKPPPADRRLAQSHEALLAASAIDADVAAERDYWTAITAKEIAGLGFAGVQQQAPALVLPVWDVQGKTAIHQVRPDRPRTIDGKTIKYETPANARMVLDVHPRVRPLLTTRASHST